MKILFVVSFYKPAYSYGGIVRSVPALCEALVRLGCDVVVFTTNAGGAASLDVTPGKEYVLNGVNVTYFSQKRSRFLYYAPELGRACYRRAKEFDLVYVVSTWGYPLLPACKAALIAKVPYVVSPRTSFMRDTWTNKYWKKMLYHRIFERRLLERAAALHYTSKVEVEHSAWLGLNARPLVVRNPVDLGEFSELPPRGHFRRQWGFAETDMIILYLGRVEPRKRIDLAIRSFCKVVQQHACLRFVIVGPEEDGYIDELKTLCASLGVSDRIIFTGMLAGQQRLSVYRDADIFILTSLCENFAVSVVEAMASALPVVITDTVGVVDDVLETSAGIAVRLDEMDVATALERLASSKQMRIDMGEAGREFANRAYLPEVVARDWLAMFKPNKVS